MLVLYVMNEFMIGLAKWTESGSVGGPWDAAQCLDSNELINNWAPAKRVFTSTCASGRRNPSTFVRSPQAAFSFRCLKLICLSRLPIGTKSPGLTTCLPRLSDNSRRRLDYPSGRRLLMNLAIKPSPGESPEPFDRRDGNSQLACCLFLG